MIEEYYPSEYQAWREKAEKACDEAWEKNR